MVIDLTPPREIKRQKTQYVVGASTKISILIFIIMLGTAGYLFSRSAILKTNLSQLETQKSELTAQKENLSNIEGYSKKLSGKYFLLQKYLESRTKYSSVMTELLARVPGGVSLDSIAMEGLGKRAKVVGTSVDVVQISTFVGRLSKEGNSSSESAVTLDRQNAFMDVRLESLNILENSPVEYSVSFKVNEGAFTK